jgi:hypothetical protein
MSTCSGRITEHVDTKTDYFGINPRLPSILPDDVAVDRTGVKVFVENSRAVVPDWSEEGTVQLSSVLRHAEVLHYKPSRLGVYRHKSGFSTIAHDVEIFDSIPDLYITHAQLAQLSPTYAVTEQCCQDCSVAQAFYRLARWSIKQFARLNDV